MKFHRDRTIPLPDNKTIFVFGSNLAGIHGAGAAKIALRFGAKIGIGVGHCGHSYAIPTKDYNIETMPINDIIPHINQFKLFTREHPDFQFFVTRVACGLAGYKNSEIAPLFAGCGDNCSFAEEWREFLT